MTVTQSPATPCTFLHCGTLLHCDVGCHVLLLQIPINVDEPEDGGYSKKKKGRRKDKQDSKGPKLLMERVGVTLWDHSLILLCPLPTSGM